MTSLKLLFSIALMSFCYFACQDEADNGFTPSEPTTTTSPGTNNGTNTADLPAVFQKFENIEDIYIDGEYVVIVSKNLPDHGSPYYETGSNLYEAYNGNNPDFRLNPNRIAEQSLTYRIPLNPEATNNNQATPLGPIGISVNGISIFNQYAGPNEPLTREINSFDQHNGHPQQTGSYHYHIEPFYLTDKNGSNSLIGFLLDGFPVYGPIEDGRRVTNEDLDEFHGHFGVTADYPEGIYHYHITDEDPYINGNGYFGTPGTVSR
ncbi:MAG: YHYH protein [Bacteroidota bacterium]